MPFTKPTIRKCKHGVYKGVNDQHALYCWLCTPGGPHEKYIIRNLKTSIAEWDKKLQKLNLGMGQGSYHTLDPRKVVQMSVMAEEKISYDKLAEQKTRNREVPDDYKSAIEMRWEAIKPPKDCSIEELLKRVDKITRDIFVMRTEGKLWRVIAKKVHLTDVTCRTRYKLAMEVMRQREAPAYTNVSHCKGCGADIKVSYNGRKREWCSDKCWMSHSRQKRQNEVAVNPVVEKLCIDCSKPIVKGGSGRCRSCALVARRAIVAREPILAFSVIGGILHFSVIQVPPIQQIAA